MVTEPILVFADPLPPELAQTLDIGGWTWKASDDIPSARSQKPAGGWAAAVVVAGPEPGAPLRLRRARRPGPLSAWPLASHPGRVFTREMLLSRVWGYEYFGGARTVDVHVRRLRAKLGEEHAGLIATVRSVGYSFGAGRWD